MSHQDGCSNQTVCLIEREVAAGDYDCLEAFVVDSTLSEGEAEVA
jgi:hypothetical protein